MYTKKEKIPSVLRNNSGLVWVPALVQLIAAILLAMILLPGPCFSAEPAALRGKTPVARAKAGETDKIRTLQSAISAHPDSTFPYLQLAEYYRGRADLKSAIPTLKGGIIYLPFSAGLRKALAEAYEDNKDFSKAIEQYQWYLQLCDPADRKAVLDTIARLTIAANDAHVAKQAAAAPPAPVKQTTAATAAPTKPAPLRKAPAAAPAPFAAARPAPAAKKPAGAAVQGKKETATPAMVTPAVVTKADTVRKKGDTINTAALKTIEFKVDSLLALVAIDTLNSAGHQMLLGIHEFMVERYDNALREFKKGAAAWPSAPFGAQCLYNTGICYCRLHLYPEAQNQFAQVLSRFPRDTLAGRALFMKAFTYAQMKDKTVAEKLCREFLAAYPRHPWMARAWTMLGDISLESGHAGAAVDAFQQALSAKTGCPDRALVWLKSGDAYRGVANIARAMACYDSAVAAGEKSDPNCMALALYKLGDERYKVKNFSGALDCYTKAVYRFPGFEETPWGIFQTGNIHRNLHNYHEAITDYKELMKRYPGNYWANQAKWQLDDTTWESEYLAKK